MSYQLLTNRTAPCFTKGRGGNTIKYIVIHHWDDPAKKPAFEGVVSWFASGRGNNSAHYVVEAGKVARMVSEADTAWHAGHWGYNQQSIGIECNPRNTEADRRTIGALIDDIQRRHGKLTIIGHKDCSATSCPGNYYPPAKTLAPYIGNRSAGSAPAPTPAPTGDIETLARAVIRGDYGNGEERRRRLGDKYPAVQKRVNQIVDGGSSAPVAPVPAPVPDVETLARAVIRGDYGNGEERHRRLGDKYAVVQKRVNEIVDGGNTPAPGPDIEALANAVIRGDYGNGEERRRRLGNLYGQVQARVNQKLGY